MNSIPKVALFADTFHETNGAANFLRRLVDFAKDKEYPFLCVRSGDETRTYNEGAVSFVDLKRGPFSIPIDGPLKFDPLLWRHRKLVSKTLADFSPDIIHITGLNDVSQLGAAFAHFRDIPAVASWHTNAHEYAARRLSSVIPWIRPNTRRKLTKLVERAGMFGLMKLYFLAQMQLAPNEELVDEIQRLTGRPSFLLGRGVDTIFFTPEKRRRCEDAFVIGFVGRLRPEKNIRFFGKLNTALQNAGVNNHRFLIVGDGSERDWLLESLPNADLTGVIHGEELARAYANMDLFVFPSQTDAFGNVVLEAMASGVPAVVMTEGGPKFLIEHGRNGFVADGDEDFIETVVQIARNPCRLPLIKQAARSFAEANAWTTVFKQIYEYYEMGKGFRKKIRA